VPCSGGGCWGEREPVTSRLPRAPTSLRLVELRSRGSVVCGGRRPGPVTARRVVAGTGWSAGTAVHIGAAPRHSSTGTEHHPAIAVPAAIAAQGRGSKLRSHRSTAGLNFSTRSPTPSSRTRRSSSPSWVSRRPGSGTVSKPSSVVNTGKRVLTTNAVPEPRQLSGRRDGSARWLAARAASLYAAVCSHGHRSHRCEVATGHRCQAMARRAV